SLLCHIKDVQGKNRFYCTFVYASNYKHERKELWKDLYLHIKIYGSQPWAIMGDMNVTLNIDEHSSGGSSVTEKMKEFKDCVNSVKVEDIGSYGFFYTWTKSLKNHDNSILKKLDRVMVSEKFLDAFEGRQAILQPFLISNHSPAIMIIPTCRTKKAKSFRFANYTARFDKLRYGLQIAQSFAEKNPHDKNLKAKSIEAFDEYNEAVKDVLMLIAAVLESISVYWASVFKLPKTIVKEINGVLKRFLWSNGDTAKGRAKVAWKRICKPKEQGGLGIKDLETWNDALLSKHVSNIASKKDTIWNQKCLLEIRDKMADKIQYGVGDRRNICMWYDKWHESGMLIDKISNRDLYDARIPKMISIDDMIDRGVWKWPNEWNSSEFEVVKDRPPRI
nr:RNA-directed DNA polymerase, eukaryota, reverse transcriptase zinc-binding domain protein [Tanacetum cinerariifolium]